LSSSVLPSRIIMSPRRKLLFWLPTLIWVCVLASFSTDVFSAEHTGSILWKIVHAVYGGISDRNFQVLHFLVRKSAHFVSYGLLSALAFFSWRATLPANGRWNIRWMRLALALTLLAASLDELHQSFVESRTGSFHDVLLDMAGALFFQFVIAFFILRREKAAALQIEA
jgi:VanZ family protein